MCQNLAESREFEFGRFLAHYRAEREATVDSAMQFIFAGIRSFIEERC
jgi:hypothetical protein